MNYTADYISIHVNHWRRLLCHLVGVDSVQMLEIGSYEGRSAEWFLTNILTGFDACIVCVDHFSDVARERRFDENMASYGHRIRKVSGQSVPALHAMLAEKTPPEFDAIYVDGSHRAADVLLDAMLAWRLLKPGGTMILDDYEWGKDLPVDESPGLGIDVLLSVLPGYGIVYTGWQVVLRKSAA